VADRSPVIQIRRPSTSAQGASNVEGRKAPERQDPHAPTSTVAWPAVAERLRQYAEARDQRAPSERCDFCGVDIADQHGHVVDLPRRMLLCVCRPCHLLFAHDGAGGARFRAVPDRYVLLPEFASAGDGWEALDIPIGLAFFLRSSATERVTAFYPSPAGATESELDLRTWDRLVRAVPPLATLAADVEALLVRRLHPHPEGSQRSADDTTAFIVPIDACYELVGRIRRSWRGFQGGDEVWRDIDEFFARVIARAHAASL
jgi:hypothetical protein